MALIDVNGKRFKNFMAKLYGWGASVVIANMYSKSASPRRSGRYAGGRIDNGGGIFSSSPRSKNRQRIQLDIGLSELATGMDDEETVDLTVTPRNSG